MSVWPSGFGRKPPSPRQVEGEKPLTTVIITEEATKDQECISDCTYRNAISILLANALGLSLALLERVLVLELAAHDDGGNDKSDR